MTTQKCKELSKIFRIVKHVLHNAVLYTRLITKTHKRCLFAIFMLSMFARCGAASASLWQLRQSYIIVQPL